MVIALPHKADTIIKVEGTKGWVVSERGQPTPRSVVPGASWDTRRKVFRQPVPEIQDSPSQQVEVMEASTERAFAIRFVGPKSPQVDCVVSVEPQQYEYTLTVHLVATKGARRIAAPDLLIWDPLSKELTWRSYGEFENIAGRLDLGIALSNFALKVIGGIMTVTGEVLENVSSPNVILIGGVLPILIAMGLFYAMLLLALKMALLFVFLPGLVLGGAILFFRAIRLVRLENALLANARAMLADYKPPGPSPRWSGL